MSTCRAQEEAALEPVWGGVWRVGCLAVTVAVLLAVPTRAGAQCVRVGGDIAAPTRLAHVDPVYPPIARAARVQGIVILELSIDVDGNVADARVLRSIPLLDAAAIDAVLQWKYAVTLVNGIPVCLIQTVTVLFTLDSGNLPPDSDGDGLPDEWEQAFGLDAGSSTGADGAAGDPDGDGRVNLQEFEDGTHPRGTFQRYLAEGATSAFFATRLALLNPGVTPAIVQVRYLKGDGTVTSQVLALPARRRQTIDVGGLAGLSNAEFSVVVEADTTIVVDRTMTWDGSGYGSHAETGVPSPAAKWYVAEGSTVSPFNLFYLIQNPSMTHASDVQITFLRPDGSTVVKSYGVSPNSRFNVWVNTVTEVASSDVSAIIETTNAVPIIVERAMYLDRPGQTFAAGHSSAGITTLATDWFLAEGATGPFFDEFVLIANPNPTPAIVRATYLLPSGNTLTKDYTVPGTSRFNIWVDEESFPGLGKALADTAVSVTLSALNGVPFIAERAMWWPGTFATWTEAHNAPGATATGTMWALAEGEVGSGVDQTDTYVLIANTSATEGAVMVTLLFEDGTSVWKTFAVSGHSRFNVWVKAEFPVALGRRFGTLVQSLGDTPAQLVVERAMYSNANGVQWAAGTAALGTRLQ